MSTLELDQTCASPRCRESGPHGRVIHRQAPPQAKGIAGPEPSWHDGCTLGAAVCEGSLVRGLQAGRAWRYRLAAGLVMLALLAGCLANPTPLHAPSDRGSLRLTAQAIAPETLEALLADAQAPQRIVAVEVMLHNVGPTSYTVAPSRMALVGPRHQRIRPVEPSSLPRYARAGSQWEGLSTPPFVNTRQESDRAIVTSASEKALRPRVLAPGDASDGWLYFPLSGRRAADDVTRQWRLAAVLQDQEQRVWEYVIPIDPPDELSR
jgi:hypothetical protein